jgi:hypothetical protein
LLRIVRRTLDSAADARGAGEAGGGEGRA